MGTLQVRVVDVTGVRSCQLEAPDDVPLERILVLLVERMQLPLSSPDGQLMSYKLHHRRTGTQLLESQTLGQAGVVPGDELRLQPEITAGCPARNTFAGFRAAWTSRPSPFPGFSNRPFTRRHFGQRSRNRRWMDGEEAAP